MALGGSSCSVFAVLLSAHIRGGGRIFFDSMPYDTRGVWGFTVFCTFLINLALFAAFAMIVFIALREFGAFAKWKRTIPYCLITVALGIPVDLLFVFLANNSYQGEINEFIKLLKTASPLAGKTASPLAGNLSFLIVPSLLAFLFLFLVQVILIRLFYKEISLSKRLIMSALISLLTLPTWGTLLLLAVRFAPF